MRLEASAAPQARPEHYVHLPPLKVPRVSPPWVRHCNANARWRSVHSPSTEADKSVMAKIYTQCAWRLAARPLRSRSKQQHVVARSTAARCKLQPVNGSPPQQQRTKARLTNLDTVARNLFQSSPLKGVLKNVPSEKFEHDLDMRTQMLAKLASHANISRWSTMSKARLRLVHEDLNTFLRECVP